MENLDFSCVKCNKKFKYKCRLDAHNKTSKHLTGQRKTKNLKPKSELAINKIKKCEICNYETKILTNYKLHILKYHKSKEDREKEFNYYCKSCDIGFYKKELFDKHLNTKKHLFN